LHLLKTPWAIEKSRGECTEMPKPKKSFGGRPAARKTEAGQRVHIGFRVPPDLKRKVERAAKDNTRSISQEAEIRLANSFLRQDAFGGPEIMQVYDLMALGFTRAGQMSAGPDKKPKEWLLVPSAYTAGIRGALRALLAGLPNKDDVATARQAILSEILSQDEREKLDAR
jgi:hypothetical protein